MKFTGRQKFFTVCAIIAGIIVMIIVIGMVFAVEAWRHASIFSDASLPSDNAVSAASVAAQELTGESFGIEAERDHPDAAGIGDGEEGGSSREEKPFPSSSSSPRSSSSSVKDVSSIRTIAASSAVVSDRLLPVLDVPQKVSSSSSSEKNISPEKISCPFPENFSASSSVSGKIKFNEIAWMGSPSSSDAGTHGANAEWIELKNDSSEEVPLAGWEVVNASGRISVRFDARDRIAAGGLLLLVRGSTTFPYAHAMQIPYSGGLSNAGDDLAVVDPSCGASDSVNGSLSGWPAGENASKETMERDADGVGWHTSADAGGTPGGENSIPPPSEYPVRISLSGAGGGTVTSVPEGILCSKNACSGTFPRGVSVAFAAKPASGTVFDGWSGACAGSGTCKVTVSGIISIIAGFHIPQPGSFVSSTKAITPETAASTSSANENSVTSSSAPHVFIAAVQIAGDASSNDYVRLYNAASGAVDMSGWKLRKRSQSGADYSLRTFPEGAVIGAGKYFVWANSENGFAAMISADVSSTETLAADNSIALIDAEGKVMDALAWGAGTGQYGEGDPFPSDPSAGQMLSRKKSGDAFIDTENNANDFSLVE